MPRAVTEHPPIGRIERRRPAGSPGTCRIAAFAGGKLTERSGTDGLADLLGRDGATLWVDLASPDAAQVAAVTGALHLHPLVAEDIHEGNQRSKIEVTEDHIHIVLFVLRSGESVSASEVDIVLGRDFLLTVHDESWDPWTTHHLRSGLDAIIAHGPDHLLWALVDTIVDDYFPFIDQLGDAIDELEDAVVRTGGSEALERIFRMKRDLVTVRRAVAPIREIFNQLTNRELAQISPDEVLYFRDVYDHLIRLTDEIDNYRELVAGTLDVYLSTVNNNLSVIMKRLTGVTVILAGIGAIAGIFGMSEAGSAFKGGEAIGFWLVSLGTFGLAGGAAWFLRRIGWI